MQRAINKLSVLSNHVDLVMAAGAIIILSLIVLPLPLFLIDSLIALNIASAVAMLTYAMYVPSPLALSTFPSLVLITTLFRVSLDIAVTRPILLHANGGDIIDTFGKLVVGGNVVVGLVVFTIITIVQFIVVAKGAERVAEVSARFTLDAMPGKQLSIDADLRAGILTEEEARQKRTTLSRESQMHGAMDGAMKFIKGDVIAGICIVIVNLIGGATIGVIMKDMAFSKALQTYAILSVGQGLVSQIPSLLISLAAGIIVTRSDSSESHLAGAISSEITRQPKALYVAGVLTLLFLLIPGFPKGAFLLCGGVVTFAGWYLLKQRSASAATEAESVEALAREGSRSKPAMISAQQGPNFTALALEVSDDIIRQLHPKALNDGLKRMRTRLVDDLGLPFPGMKIRRRPEYQGGQWSLSLFEDKVGQGQLEGISVADAQKGPISSQASGLVVDALIQQLEPILRQHASRLIGIQETQALVTACRQDYPDLVQMALQATTIPRISVVLNLLVSEGIPIRNLRDILEAMIEHGPREKDDVMLAEKTRVNLRHAIARIARGNQGEISGVFLDQATEDALRRALKTTPSGVVIALSGDQLRGLAESIYGVSQQAITQGLKPVLVVPADLRRHLRKLLEIPLPNLLIVSFAELPANTPTQQFATISL